MRIHIPGTNLKRMRNQVVKEMYIELHHNRLKYVSDFTAEIPTNDNVESEPALWTWEKDRVYVESTFAKTAISGCEIMLMNDCWKVQLLVNGNIDLYFLVSKKAHARSLYEYVMNYLFDEDFKFEDRDIFIP